MKGVRLRVLGIFSIGLMSYIYPLFYADQYFGGFASLY